MKANKEITALLTLIDDPDEEVFDTVSEKILNYGNVIIPNLESLWEVTADEHLQERIEQLIHRVHFQDLQQDFEEWMQSEKQDLFLGALLVAKFQFPEMNVTSMFSLYEKIRKDLWLELNSYLSPLEQANVINSILYNYYKLEGHELSQREPKYFFINQVLESRHGNTFSIGLLYLSLCEALDIPLFAVNIPRQFIFAFIETVHSFSSLDTEGVQQIQFFVDPMNGVIYTQKEVDVYLKKINADDRVHYFLPVSNSQILSKMLEELAQCYRYKKEDDKAREIETLRQIVNE